MNTAVQLNEVTHTYQYQGKPLVSVTQVLKRAGQVGEWGDEEDLRRGEYVHKAWEHDDKGCLDLRKVPLGLRGYVYGWRNWKRDSGFRPQMIELSVCDPQLSLAGRPDRVGILPAMNGLRAVVDGKSSKAGGVPPWARYQLAAYAMMLRRTEGERLYRVAVGVMPDGKYRVQVFPVEELLRDWAQFLQWLQNSNQGY